jgi:hypothetical protein
LNGHIAFPAWVIMASCHSAASLQVGPANVNQWWSLNRFGKLWNMDSKSWEIVWPVNNLKGNQSDGQFKMRAG